MQGTLAREYISTQDTLAREHVSTLGTLARGHVRHVISETRDNYITILAFIICFELR